MSLSDKVGSLRRKAENLLHKVNPCHEDYPQDSWGWWLMCRLFPDCWCCAGLRGFCYGVILTGLIAWGIS